jgi:hypothetical protein
MKSACAAFAVLAAALALPALSADTLPVAGSPALRYLLAPHVDRIRSTSDVAIDVNPVGTSQAMLDLIDGKSAVAGVVMSLPEALAAAREAAWAEGRMLRVPGTLMYHQVGAVQQGSQPVGFVTVGEPSYELQRVLGYLRSANGRELFAGR